MTFTSNEKKGSLHHTKRSKIVIFHEFYGLVEYLLEHSINSEPLLPCAEQLYLKAYDHSNP